MTALPAAVAAFTWLLATAPAAGPAEPASQGPPAPPSLPSSSSPSAQPVSPAQPVPGPRGVVIDRIAAVVGDDVVPESDVSRYVKVGFLERRDGEDEETYRGRALDQRVTDLLRERDLRKTAGFAPDEKAIDARFAEVEARIEKERGMPFEAVLERAGVSRAEARDWVRSDLEIETFVRERLLPAVKISDADVEAYYEGQFRKEAADAGITQVPPLKDVRDELKVVLRSRRLNSEIDRWTEDLRAKTRILVYKR